MYLDDSACNLASLNLRKFQRADSSFDVEAFKRAVEITILAQEIIVGNARYPTETIEENSHRFRPLGLGYANLGSLLMSLGLPYDSRGGARLVRVDHLADDRLGLPHQRGHRARRDRAVRRLPGERGAVPAGDAEAPPATSTGSPRPTCPSIC